MEFTTRAWVWKSRAYKYWVVSTGHGNYWPFPTWERAMCAANTAVSLPDEIWEENGQLLELLILEEVPPSYTRLLVGHLNKGDN